MQCKCPSFARARKECYECLLSRRLAPNVEVKCLLNNSPVVSLADAEAVRVELEAP
jgi:hypothetical protein